MGRKAAVYNITVTRGSTWTESFTYTDDAGLPIDLTNYGARMQVRTLPGRYGTTTTETLVMELLSTGGSPRLFVTPLTGQVDLSVSAADTAAILCPLNKRIRYVYGLELVDSSVSPEVVIPFLTGRISVRPEISR